MTKTVGAALAAILAMCGASAAPGGPADDAAKMNSGMMNPGSAIRTVEPVGGGGFRVLVYGNSIALHGPKPDIGWTNSWGMAASAREKDFAHLVVAGLEAKLGKKADSRIRNVASLERNFMTNVATVAEIAADAKWAPDYVVIALGENVPAIDASNAAAYTKFLADIARPFADAGAKVVLRSPFWMNATKAECTAAAAADTGCVYVDAGPLGFDDENKAIGLFSHSGVANHPGDLGMSRLAELVLAGFAAAEDNPVCRAEVRFGGSALAISRARVSAVPFNRVWPGCQRSMDQTRMSAFVGFDVPEAGGTLEVDFGHEAPKSARIRPFSREQPVLKGGTWSVEIRRPEQFVVEFDGGGELHVFADPPWKDVADGAGVVRFGPGEHHPGAIIPKSGDTIIIERGATVHGNFVLTGVDDVAIIGRGVVDGSLNRRLDDSYAGVRHLKAAAARSDGSSEVNWSAGFGTTPVVAAKCRNLKIEGVTFVDAPNWTMNLHDCEHVEIRNVKLVGMWRYNSDGIDICSSRDALVADSFVRSFDDCVIARPPFSGMLVTNCVLWCDWGHNMKVQHAQLPSVMENLVFSDVKAINVDGLLASVTTRYGSTNCVIRNVAYRNIEVDAPDGRLQPRLQGNGEWKYTPSVMEDLSILRLYAYSLGRPTPNQGRPIPVDESTLRILYDGVEMDGVSVFSRPGARVEDRSDTRYSVECVVETCIDNFIVRNLRLNGLPKCATVVKKAPKGKIR